MSYARPDLRPWTNDFSAGFLDTPQPDYLPVGTVVAGANAEFASVDPGRRAVLQKRRGSTLIAPTSMGLNRKVDGLFDYRRPLATPQLVAVCDGKVFAFDNVDTFDQVGATAPFTAGRPARACQHRAFLFLHDGTAQQRYDGTDLHAVGLAAPSSLTNMVGTAASGVTGTFDAVYTWYVAATGHESSPSEPVPAVALVDQERLHTRPGSPPAAATHWRIYVRRTDVYETQFWRVATVVIGTTSHAEAVPDANRRDPWPQPNSLDPPPGAWSILVEFQGFYVGVLPDDDSFFVSKLNNPEGWHPRDRFYVRGADGDAITSVQSFGEVLLVQKPHSTWRVSGTIVPFAQKRIHTSYGNVSQEAGLEVNDKFYAWDRVRGPYVTDLVSWTPLADHKIELLLKRVNRAALSTIRAVHDETNQRILWEVPLDGATTPNAIVAYSTALSTWLPPWTGLRYAALTQFSDPSGALHVYAGDHDGRVFRLSTGTREGVPITSPDSVVRAPVVNATSTTVEIAGGLYTTGSGLVGLPVAVRSPAGNWQWRRILSNTATEVTIDLPWLTVPEAGWEMAVGGIAWEARFPILTPGGADRRKRWSWLFVQGLVGSPAHLVHIEARFDEDDQVREAWDVPLSTGASLWGQLVWGVDPWGGGRRALRKFRLEHSSTALQVAFSNGWPDEPVVLTQYGAEADALDRGRAPSAEVE